MAFSINPGMDIASGLSYYLFICLFFMICDKFHHDKRVVLPSPKIKLGKKKKFFKQEVYSFRLTTRPTNQIDLIWKFQSCILSVWDWLHFWFMNFCKLIIISSVWFKKKIDNPCCMGIGSRSLLFMYIMDLRSK